MKTKLDYFGSLLKSLRENSELSFREFGKLCGKDAPYLWKLEHSRAILPATLSTLLKIIDPLNPTDTERKEMINICYEWHKDRAMNKIHKKWAQIG